MTERLKAYDPKFTHFLVRPIDPLTPKLKARRVREARTLLSQGLARRKRTFYIDAKTLLVTPTTHQVIGYKEDMEKYGLEPIGGAKWRGVVTGQRALTKIQFYCMVNWHVGVCGFWVCQGSSGVAPVYQVGEPFLCPEKAGGLAMHAAVHKRPVQSSCPSAVAAARGEAQHAEPGAERSRVEQRILGPLVLPIRHWLPLVRHAIHLDAQPLLLGEVHACIHRTLPVWHPVLEGPRQPLLIQQSPQLCLIRADHPSSPTPARYSSGVRVARGALQGAGVAVHGSARAVCDVPPA
jgi:hypothetical protein